MKGYTDIEQSRKLATILPLESANMYYPWDIDSKSFLNIPIVKDDSYYMQGSIDCWSLASLLGVLPKIGAEEPMVRKLYYASEPKERYICGYSITNITGEYNNPVDACYEMIIKLNELKML